MQLFRNVTWDRLLSFDPSEGGYGFGVSLFAVVLVWIVFDRAG
ncbi:MAG: hypothetical protein WD847_10620 [Pirellulales bacterium]|jgi:hypothetical protein